MENRFEEALERYQPESGEEERLDEILSEAGEDMELGATPNEEVVHGNFSPGTTRELLHDLSGHSHTTLWIPLEESRVATGERALEYGHGTLE